MKYLFFLITLSTLVQAAASEETYSTYDDIVRELAATEMRSSKSDLSPTSSFDQIRLHASVGFVASRLQLRTPGAYRSAQSLQGAEALFGIDLFSRNWIAEGAVRSYNPEQYSHTDIQLKEFDLRLAHEDLLSSKLDYRIGGGMSARYLSFGVPFAEADKLKQEYTTPASVLFVGLKGNITRSLGVAAELAYRASLIDDSIDRNSVDGSLRVTGTF